MTRSEQIRAGKIWPGELTPEDIKYHNTWKPASGQPGGWRVVRGISPLQEHNGPSGRLVLFKSMAAAQRRADELNTPQPKIPDEAKIGNTKIRIDKRPHNPQITQA